jgi:hypothetical protein
MPDLTHRQQKIQEKRKQTPFRNFVMEIASRQPVGFYKNQGLISRYPDTNRTGILIPPTQEIDTTEFFIDKPRSHFFEDMTTLKKHTPLTSLIYHGIVENSEYADAMYHTKNNYLTIGSYTDTENILYSFDIRRASKNVFNALEVHRGENIYTSMSIIDCFNVFFSKSINNSNNIRYSVGMNGCSECIECSNLENKSYCIKNQQYTKEEYFIRKQQLKTSIPTYQQNYANLKGQFLERGNDKVNGIGVVNSKNVENGFLVDSLLEGRNVFLGGARDGVEKYYDTFVCAMSDNFYAVIGSGARSHHLYCSANLAECTNIFYSLFLNTCSFCL